MSDFAVQVIVLVLGAIVSFLFGEKLYTWFFLHEDKTAKRTDNFTKLADVLQSGMNAINAQLDRSNKDSAEKQELIIQQQKDLYLEREEKAKLKEDLAVAKCRECRVHGCKDREPQTGY